jgi:hypothetical protein
MRKTIFNLESVYRGNLVGQHLRSSRPFGLDVHSVGMAFDERLDDEQVLLWGSHVGLGSASRKRVRCINFLS